MPVNEQAKKQRRSAHQTQWAAQFAVASELCKRGYEVAFTMGNHPLVDLMVISPSRISFLVDVKGLYKKNFWLVREKKPRDKLFYVFAFAPDNASNQFLVLTQDQIAAGIRADMEHTRVRQSDKGRTLDENGYLSGIEWDFAVRYKDAWEA
jgi:hypothetical protein